MALSRQIHAELLRDEQQLAGEQKLDPVSGAETDYHVCRQLYTTTSDLDGVKTESFATLQRLGVGRRDKHRARSSRSFS